MPGLLVFAMPANSVVEEGSRLRGPPSRRPADEEFSAGGYDSSNPSSQSTLQVSDVPARGTQEFTHSWHRFIRKGKSNIGIRESIKAIALSSCSQCVLSQVHMR